MECSWSLGYPWKTEFVLLCLLLLCCKFLNIISPQRIQVDRIYHHWFRPMFAIEDNFLNNGVISSMDVTCQKNFFFPNYDDVVSQPLNSWKNRNAKDSSGPKVLKSFSYYFETFWCFSKFPFHQNWDEAVINNIHGTYKLPNDFRFRILGKIWKISKLARIIN